jgi:hypothetical protein
VQPIQPVKTGIFNPDLFQGRPVLILNSGTATAPGATLQPIVPNGTDPLNIMAFNYPTYRAFIYDSAVFAHAAGDFQILLPQGHDQVNNIQDHFVATNPYPLWPKGRLQEVFPQDKLGLNISGSANPGDIENAYWKLLYQQLPSAKQVNLFVEELDWYAVNYLTVQLVITTSGAAGYSGGVSLANAFTSGGFNNMKGNTWYAIVGITVADPCGAVTILGTDTGGFRRGQIGQDFDLTIMNQCFVDEARYFKGIPTIPCVNSANNSNTIIEIAGNETAITTAVTLHMLQLRDKQ